MDEQKKDGAALLLRRFACAICEQTLASIEDKNRIGGQQMQSDEVGSIQLERLSVVTLPRLKAFLQMASEARQADDTGAEEFLAQLAAV